ncbi:MAG TPA: DUF302 domain-containing protein [Candidatus Thioglobus sp.]|jgi:hypothetical protein|nr:DUF302 domain-containing protein [Candidatus Thioglobus sp.]HIB30454.1 DUF302 domain-containing protein [Candidatus Thioglobus sp.]HIB97923.1 DUF302 domain-containing protein [Candidatus Thioglobus sp.]
MSSIINFTKWMIITLVAVSATIGAITIYYGASLQVKYDGVTGKVISEILSPTLHPDAMKKVYMPMANTLLDTGDMAMTTIVRVPIADNVSTADIEEAMITIAFDESVGAGGMPISEIVESQTGEKQRLLKIFRYCSPITAMAIIEYSDAFSTYLPCRIALIEDKSGKRWLYTLNMDVLIYGGRPLSKELYEQAIELKRVMIAIQKGGAKGEF